MFHCWFVSVIFYQARDVPVFLFSISLSFHVSPLFLKWGSMMPLYRYQSVSVPWVFDYLILIQLFLFLDLRLIVLSLHLLETSIKFTILPFPLSLIFLLLCFHLHIYIVFTYVKEFFWSIKFICMIKLYILFFISIHLSFYVI